MALGGAILGGAILGGAMPMPQVAPASLSYSLYDGYRLEIRDTDGDRVAVMVDAYDIQLTETVSEPGSLKFSIPVAAWYSDLLVPPNYVALYNRAGELVQVFEIVDEEEESDTQRVKHINCAGPLYLLNDDSIDYQNYESELDTPDTAVATITAILALQTNTRKVTLGGIEAALSGLTFGIKAEWETPLAALHQLRGVIGGFFWVDKDLKLWWRQSYTTNDTRDLRWQKNLIGFQPTIENDRVITHLRYFGRETAGVPLSLPSPGYLVSSYYSPGDRKRWHTETDNDIYLQDTLEKAAALFLSEQERPSMRATVRILDLSQSPEYDFDEWYGVQLGDLVNVYHPSLGASPVALTVVSRSVNLARPMDVSLELGEMPPDIARIIADIRHSQRRRERNGGGSDLDIAGFETDPNVFAPPGTPDTIDVGTSPNTIRSDAILPILPGIGYTPEPIAVGTGSPGLGPYAAPQDHVHPLDPSEIKTDFETDGFVTDTNFPDFLADALTDPLDSGVATALDGQIEDWASDDEPEPVVAESPAAGNLDKFARADHTHLGQPWIVAADKATLPTGEPDGVIGYTNDEDLESPWHRVAGAWVQPTIYLGVVTTLPAIPTAYAATCRFATQLWCAAPGDSYWTPMQRQTTYSGAPGTGYP